MSELKQIVSIEDFEKTIKSHVKEELFEKTTNILGKGNIMVSSILLNKGMTFLELVTKTARKYLSDDEENISRDTPTIEVSNESKMIHFMAENWELLAPYWITVESPMNYFLSIVTLIEKLNVGQGRERVCLSLGSGPGLYEIFLSKLIEKKQMRFIASDYSSEMVRAGKAYAKFNDVNNVNFEQIDMTSIPYRNESIDVVIVNNSLQWVHNQNKAISEVARILKFEGEGHLIVHKHAMSIKYQNVSKQAELETYIIPTISIFDALEENGLQLCSIRELYNSQGQHGNDSARLYITVKKINKSFKSWKEKAKDGEVTIKNAGGIMKSK